MTSRVRCLGPIVGRQAVSRAAEVVGCLTGPPLLLTILTMVPWPVTASTALQQASATPPIAVHIAAPVRDGFIDIDKAIRDSIKDLQNNIRNKPGLVVAQSQAGADVTLRVLGRGVVSQRVAEVALPFLTGVAIAPMYASKKVVRVELEAGDFRKDFVEFEDGYGDCAEEIARQAQAWINANRSTLIERRSSARP